jgi:hypothetical protein
MLSDFDLINNKNVYSIAELEARRAKAQEIMGGK